MITLAPRSPSSPPLLPFSAGFHFRPLAPSQSGQCLAPIPSSPPARPRAPGHLPRRPPAAVTSRSAAGSSARPTPNAHGHRVFIVHLHLRAPSWPPTALARSSQPQQASLARRPIRHRRPRHRRRPRRDAGRPSRSPAAALAVAPLLPRARPTATGRLLGKLAPPQEQRFPTRGYGKDPLSHPDPEAREQTF